MSKYDIRNLDVDIGDSKKKILLAVAALFLVFSVFYYGGSNQPDNRDSEYNRADLMFMNMMIIHHDQAIEMADMAENRTDNQKILNLSQNISQAQREENEKMSNWLEEAGFRRPMRRHRMAGMATQQEMNELRQSEGKQFDLLFSKLMIEHHEGGIDMARAEVRNGESEKVIELANEMVRVQNEEVDKMESWRKDWVEDT